MTGAPDIETRPRPKRDQAEHGLSHWVDVFLERALSGACWFTAVETGTWMVGMSPEARMNAETKRRARGIKPSHLDWYVYQVATGLYAQIELKVDGRPTRRGQDRTIAALRRNGIRTDVCETVPEVFAFLRDAGFALHGNAENIAAELHEKYLAKRREHGTKKKSRPVRGARSSASDVSRAHAMGWWK